MAKYVYPAIFTKEDDGQYSIEFPDIPYAHSCGKNLTDAMYMAEDCLGFVLLDLQNDKKEFPKASDIANYENTKDSFATLVNIDLTEYKRRVDDKPVKKTLYIPKQLNEQAEAMAINFSEVLRQALKERLVAQN